MLNQTFLVARLKLVKYAPGGKEAADAVVAAAWAGAGIQAAAAQVSAAALAAAVAAPGDAVPFPEHIYMLSCLYKLWENAKERSVR